MTIRTNTSLPGEVTRVAHGALMMMVGAQSALEDIEGGVRAGQWHLVLAQTRYLVLICCQARGLAFGAEPYVAEDGGAIDPHTHAPAEDWESGHRLIREAREFAAAAGRAVPGTAVPGTGDPGSGAPGSAASGSADDPGRDLPGDWLDRLHAWVGGIEATLGLAEPLPQLRSPDGMFGALRLVRGWHELADRLGVAPLLPTEWTKPL
ncbi:hypothetical protein ACWF94_16540 [Streptomyces sp. NPDC055078]